MNKVCRTCNKILSFKNFFKVKSSKDKYRHDCKTCVQDKIFFNVNHKVEDGFINIFVTSKKYGDFKIKVNNEDFNKINGYKLYVSGRPRQRGLILYCKIYIEGKLIPLHRYILNAKPGECVDHINNDPLDNRKENLRIVTNQQNSFNRVGNKGTSKYKGVSWNKNRKKWYAYICPNGMKISLGVFLNEIDAAIAYNEAALKYFGEFARLNDI